MANGRRAAAPLAAHDRRRRARCRRPVRVAVDGRGHRGGGRPDGPGCVGWADLRIRAFVDRGLSDATVDAIAADGGVVDRRPHDREADLPRRHARLGGRRPGRGDGPRHRSGRVRAAPRLPSSWPELASPDRASQSRPDHGDPWPLRRLHPRERADAPRRRRAGSTSGSSGSSPASGRSPAPRPDRDRAPRRRAMPPSASRALPGSTSDLAAGASATVRTDASRRGSRPSRTSCRRPPISPLGLRASTAAFQATPRSSPRSSCSWARS